MQPNQRAIVGDTGIAYKLRILIMVLFECEVYGF